MDAGVRGRVRRDGAAARRGGPAAGQEYGASLGHGDAAVYELGGAVPIKAFQGFSGRAVEARLRFGWTGDLQCGSFDIAASIADQLGSAESAARQMMGNIVSSAQGVVASLPGLVLQRLNPSLYDMLTGMMAEAGIGFRMARANCERTVDAMRDRTAAGGWRALADGEFWKRQLGANAEPTAAARAAGANAGGDAGATWIGGSRPAAPARSRSARSPTPPRPGSRASRARTPPRSRAAPRSPAPTPPSASAPSSPTRTPWPSSSARWWAMWP